MSDAYDFVVGYVDGSVADLNKMESYGLNDSRTGRKHMELLFERSQKFTKPAIISMLQHMKPWKRVEQSSLLATVCKKPFNVVGNMKPLSRSTNRKLTVDLFSGAINN